MPKSVNLITKVVIAAPDNLRERKVGLAVVKGNPIYCFEDTDCV